MEFDLPTLAVTALVNSIVLALAMSFQWLAERTIDLRNWAIGFVVMGAGGMMFGAHVMMPGGAYAFAGGTTMLVGFVIVHSGLAATLGARWSHWNWLPVPVAAIAYACFTWLSPNVAGIAAVTGVARFVVCAQMAALLLRYRGEVASYAMALALLSMATMGIFMLVRGCMAIFHPEIVQLAHGRVPAVVYLVNSASGIGMMLGLLAVHTDGLLVRLGNVANTDALTGLHNRRHFERLARRELERARARAREMWALMLDIDDFKSVNDNFGHAEGDRVLQDVSAVLARALRRSDIVARYGGEEFCILLPYTEPDQVRMVAERLLESVRTVRRSTDADAGPVTVSIGVARGMPDSPGLDGLLGRADHALYDAKHAGKNRIAGLDQSVAA